MMMHGLANPVVCLSLEGKTNLDIDILELQVQLYFQILQIHIPV
jgi:hypothetical protein